MSQTKTEQARRPGGGQLLTLEELARALGEGVRTIRNWQHKGIVRPCVLGHRTYRYRLDDVLEAISRRQVKNRGGNGQ